MELEVQRLGIEMATALKCIRKLTRTKTVRLLLVLFAGVLAAGAADLARAWKTEHFLSNAAREAARITTCETRNGTFCLAIDMTSIVERNGTLIPGTRVTLQYPHAWALGSVVKPFSSRAIARLPNALSTSAIMRF
jgi:hypothetical protein